jgi:hypothetical protein
MRYDDVGTRNKKSLFGRGIDPTTRIPHRNVVNVDPQPGGLSSGGRGCSVRRWEVRPGGGRVCGAVPAMTSPIGGGGPPPGLSGTTRTLASPTLGGATPVTTARGDGGQPQQSPPWGLWSLCEGAHGSGVLFEEMCAMLQLPPSRALRQSRKMDWQAPMMPLSCSSNCCDLIDANPRLYDALHALMTKSSSVVAQLLKGRRCAAEMARAEKRCGGQLSAPGVGSGRKRPSKVTAEFRGH